MKRIIFNIFLVLLFTATLQAQQVDRSQPPEPGPAPQINLGKYDTFTLDNGLKVIVVENHKLPRVSFQLKLDIDPVKEGDKAGYVSMAGDLLRSGTTNRSKEQIDEAIDFIGGRLSTYSTGMYGASLTQHEDTLLMLMSDVLLHPTFPEAELEKNRKQTITALQSSKDDPETIAANVAEVLNYGADNPYGEQVTEKTVEDISRQDLVNYYQTYFKPNVAYLVIVGDVTEDRAKELANSYFGSWEKGDVPTRQYNFPPAPSGDKVAFVNKPGAVQSVISVTYPVNLKPGSPDDIPADVTNAILGGGVFSGRLMQNLREKHAYTYGARSTISADRLMGSFDASASVRNSVTDSSVTQILYEMKRMRNEDVSADHLELVKNVLSGSFARSLERPQTIASFALNTQLYNLPSDYYATYLKKIAAVTPADVRRMSEKYILPGHSYILVVGNKKEVAPTLKKFAADGEVNFYDFYGEPVKDIKPAPEGMTAQDVINNYLKAIGGVKKLKKIKNVTTHAKTSIQGMDINIVIYQKVPDKFMMDMKMNGNDIMKQVYDGEHGYIKSMMGEVEVTGDTLAKMKEQSMVMPALHYSDEGYKLELAGIEEINGQEAYVVNITSPGGFTSTAYFSTDSGLIIRNVSDIGGNQQASNLSDYKEVNGVKYPFKRTTKMGPQEVTINVTEVDNKSKIKDEVFEMGK
ncbi:MAG TPA: pitrilysin family protein [Bacteroidales bacterium]|nr:pitrilysin family protein [Bacteroidales bacterium]